MAVAYPRLGNFRRWLLAGTAAHGLLAAGGVGLAHAAGALPQGGQVIGGSASIAYTSPTQLDITSTTNNSAIAWQSFDIANGSKVTVNQPGTNSTQLEQVTGPSASQIFGALNSNGRIVVANPNGIWFGPSAQVDVAGLVATTAHPSPADVAAFAAGGSLNLSRPGNANASVINQGSITISQAGLAAFVAPGVENDGVIQAKLGKVQLASGTTATLDFYGDGLINLAVTGQTAAQALGPDGKPLAAAVNNTGAINADGGTVLMTANTAAGVVDQVINITGIVQARAVAQQGGQIVLDGGDNGAVMVAGTLDASGRGAGQTGGTVNVLGNKVQLASTAVVDVSGDAGGGTALIGGNFHGAGPQRNAATTTVAKGAKILADAVSSGNGGKVAVWSNQSTNFDGAISAKGGAQGGDGGQVETSGESLTVGDDAIVDASAAAGSAGNWLLDPVNGYVNSTGTPPATDPNAGAISNAAVQNGLANNDVTITAGAAAFTAAGAAGASSGTASAAQPGDLFVTAPIAWSSGHILNLTATHSLYIEAPITHTFSGSASGLVLSYNGGVTPNLQTSPTAGRLYVLDLPSTGVNGKVTLDATHDSLTINSQAYQLITDLSQLNLASGFFALDADLSNPATNFTGQTLNATFEGLGHTISNLVVADNSTDVGFFGAVGATGVVSDLVVSNATISVNGGSTSVDLGVLAGTNSGTIANVSIDGGSVVGPTSAPVSNQAHQAMGGLVGTNEGVILTSSSTAAVTGNGKGSQSANVFEYDIGGLVGFNDTTGQIYGSASQGAVSSTNKSGNNVFAGGFTGDNTGKVAADFSNPVAVSATGAAAVTGDFAAACTPSCTNNALTISVAPDTKVYDGTDASTVKPVTAGLLSGDRFIALSEAFSSPNVGINIPMTLATSSLLVNWAGNPPNAPNYYYTATLSNANVGTITPAPVTVTGTRVYDAATDASFSILSANGVIGSDVVTVASGSGTLANKDVGSEGFASLGNLALGGADGGNYQIVLAGSSVNITKANVTVSGTRVYDAATDANAAILAANGVFAGDTVMVASGAGTLASKNVGSEGFASLGNLALGGADAGNYQIMTAGSSVNVTKANVTVSGTRVYDAAADANAAILMPGGVFAGDTVTVASGTGTLTSKNVGSEGFASLGNLALGGADGGNYQIVTAGSSVNITKAPLSVSGTRVYDANTDAAFSVLSPIVGAGSEFAGDTVTVASGTGTLASKNVGSEGLASIGTLALGGTDAGNYQIVTAGSSVNITKANVTVSGTRVYDAETDANAAILSANGVFAGDTVTVASGAGTLTSKNVGNEALATLGNLALGGADGGNYQIVTAGSSVNITKAPLSVSGTRVYDANTDAAFSVLSPIVGAGSEFAGDNVTVASGAGTLASKNVGSEGLASIGTLTLGGTDAGNYQIVTAGSSVNVTKANVTVSGTRVYDAATDANAAILTPGGVFAGDTVTVASGAGTLTNKDVGSEGFASLGNLALGGADGGNYQIVLAGSSVNITKANVTVSGTRVYDGATDANAAILAANGVFAGDNVTVASGAGTLASKNVGNESFTSLGNLALGGADGGNYQIVMPGSAVSITPATLTVSADAQTKVYGTNDPALTFQTSGLQGADTANTVLSGGLTRDLFGTLAGEQVGSYNITQGALTANANYTLVYNANTLKITPLLGSLAVTVNPGQSKMYGNNDPGLSFGVTGLVNRVVDGVLIQDTAANLFSGALARSGSGTFPGEQVGNYAITEGSLSLVAGTNYGGEFSFTGGNFAITPRPLTITANNQHKDPNTIFTFTGSEFAQSGLFDGVADGVQLSDGISAVTLTSAGAPLAAAIGIYPINVSSPVGTGLSNYSIGLKSGTMTVGVPCATVTQCAGPNVVQSPPSLSSVLDVQFINPAAGVACNQPPSDPNQRPDDANQLLNDLNRNPCLKENLIAVLPEANGHVGAVVVHTANGGTYLLNKAFAAVGSAAGSGDMRPVSFDSSEVSSDLTTALQALPRVFTVYFGNGSTVMLPRSQLDFTRALGDIKQRGAKAVVITGHTDTVGTEAYNDALSLRRAQSIEQMLIKGGIPPAWLKIVGDGTRNPAVPTTGNVPQELNRRVVIDAQ